VNLRLRYVPAVPVTLACQLVLYVDLDPSDDPSVINDADNLIRQAVAQTGAQQWNFHTPKVIPMAMRTDQQFYFTGEDRTNVRFSQQGRAYLIQVTQALDVSGTVIGADIESGSIFFDWSVDFNTPQLNPEGAIELGRRTNGKTLTTTITANSTSKLLDPGSELLPRTRYVVSCQANEAEPETAANASISLQIGSGPGVNFISWNSSGQVTTVQGTYILETDSQGQFKTPVTFVSTNMVVPLIVSHFVTPLRNLSKRFP
jgi:hypothetical protein